MVLSPPQGSIKSIYAAEYVRMSTEHQKYSLDNQSEYIREYSLKNNITIIHTYHDAGKSGLNISGRPGLKALLDDVINRKIKISAILVYDVSRFGRFQDADEAGHYSHLLRKNGVKIIYCAEPFSEEHPEMFMLGLSFSRHGAASYSRNLSEKVFRGQVNLIQKGYHQGGMPGYGLRRLLIDEHHVPKGVLKFGQRKSIQTDRIILSPGPLEEISIVNKIFDMFNLEGKPEIVIASELNRSLVLAENGSDWTRAKVNQILTNEKYIGNSVYNKTSFKLKQQYIKNPEDEWVRFNGAYKPIVSVDKFNLAQEIIASRMAVFTDDELLEKLSVILIKRGRLSGVIIDEEALLPSSSTYRSRFGSLLRVYSLIGYNPRQDYTYLETNKILKGVHSSVINTIVENIYKSDGWVTDSPTEGILNINDEFTLSVKLARCQRLSGNGLRWKIRFNHLLVPDISIAIRMDSLNKFPIDYYIFPSIDEVYHHLSLKEKNTFQLELYKFNTLNPFYHLVRRTTLIEKIK
ncbi:resolvase family site-specific recombinase [Yersinia intermedia]|uniref:recombinase family protein n=1 Tax=Yersinia intermedia TaxID=631 RepID=UPI0005E41E21|nr:recombinase family protein [Yersinia intermedia]CNI33406.1 resolvase family site-specific recombinase [Yersinia intermedia]CQD84627.1 resolvase family site-specific recombinase [Yersinia intermedia]